MVRYADSHEYAECVTTIDPYSPPTGDGGAHEEAKEPLHEAAAAKLVTTLPLAAADFAPLKATANDGAEPVIWPNLTADATSTVVL